MTREVSLVLGLVTALLAPLSPLRAQQPEDGADSEAPIAVATWKGGSLDRAEHESWLRFKELTPNEAAVREHVWLESLAATAHQRGAERETKTRLELEAMRQAVLVTALRHHALTELPEPSPVELDRLAEEHPDAFHRPRKLQLRNLYKRLGSGPQAAAVRARMDELHSELLAGADFDALARAESESQSRLRGGRLGYVDPAQLPPEVAKVVQELLPGELSEPVEHGGGISILRCDRIREAQSPTPEELRSKLRTNLVRQRSREHWQKYREHLLDAAAPRIDPGGETVLEMAGYRMERSELRPLVEVRAPGLELDELDTAAITSLLRDWALGVEGARRAAQLGLDRLVDVASTLRWRTLAILANHELERRLNERLRPPTEEELRERFLASAERYREPERFELSVVQLPASDPASIELARGIARRLDLKTLEFTEAARRYSVHPSATNGGSVGWQSRRQVGSLGPGVLEMIRELAPGERTDLLHLESGLFLFLLTDFEAARPASFEEARERVREELSAERRRHLEVQLRGEELSRIELVIAR